MIRIREYMYYNIAICSIYTRLGQFVWGIDVSSRGAQEAPARVRLLVVVGRWQRFSSPSDVPMIKSIGYYDFIDIIIFVSK